MQVSVSCFAKLHAFHLADQLHKHGVLKRLITSYYGKFGRKQNNAGLSIPREKVSINLLSAGLFYTNNPVPELWRHHFFGNWAASKLTNENIVVTWGLSALPVIQRARQIGAISIVERGSAHAAVQRDLLLEEYEMHGQPTEALKRGFSKARMERELLEYELADFIQVPSSFALRSFIQQGISERKLIKGITGVDLKHFYPLPKEDDIFRVVYVGQMSLQKGVQYLLRAFAELKLPKAELWLIGSFLPEIAPFFSKYERFYRFWGVIPRISLVKYLTQSSVFAICSIQEGLALVQPQAMSCALPLICTTNTGGEDLIADGVEGFILPIRDVEALKEKLLFLYKNPDICREMGLAARRKVEHGLTWDDFGHRIVSAYQAITKELSRGRSCLPV